MPVISVVKVWVAPASHWASVRSPQLPVADGATGPYNVPMMTPASPSSPETVTTSLKTVPGSPLSEVTCVATVGLGTGASATITSSVVAPAGIVNVVTLFAAM